METYELPGQGLKIKHSSKSKYRQGKEAASQIYGSCYALRNFRLVLAMN